MSATIENPRNEEHFHPEHASELLQKLQLLLGAGKNGGGLCDVVLIAGKNGQRVPGHRVILAASSPYFEALFTGNMRESAATEVTLGDDVHGDYLQALVQFCYTGKIEICEDTVDELILTASRLQLDAVVNGCSKFMERRLDASNCLGVIALANLLSLTHLTHVAKKKACKDFGQVSQEEEFLQLDIDELKVLIASDDLNVPSEEAVFHSVMSWVHYDKGKRSKHIPALLALVRLSLLPISFLTEHGKIWDLCHEHPECLPQLKEACEESNVPIDSRRIKPRNSTQPSLVAVWDTTISQGIEIAEYTPAKDEWKLIGKTLITRTSYAAACFNNELIIVGGIDCIYASKTVESINLDTMTLSKLDSISLKRIYHSIAVLDGLVYVVGGISHVREDFVCNVERYNPNNSEWNKVAPLSVERMNFGLAVLYGRLYAVGGQGSHRTVLNSTECYDPQTDKWTQLANLNQSRYEFGIVSGNGFLYAIGGWGDNGKLKSIERYDPQADKWTVICSIYSPHNIVGGFFFDDRLLAVSSYDKGISIQEFNLVTGTYTERATLLKQGVSQLRAFLKIKAF